MTAPAARRHTTSSTIPTPAGHGCAVELAPIAAALVLLVVQLVVWGVRLAVDIVLAAWAVLA